MQQVKPSQTSQISQTLYHAFSVAYQQAVLAQTLDEVPVGACLIYQGEIIAAAHNQIKNKKDPTAHAELEVIKKASQKMNNERLNDTILVSTLEPCGLCSTGIILARVKEVHFLTFEERIPALRKILSLHGHNHIPKWKQHEIEEFDSAELLRNFFKEKRLIPNSFKNARMKKQTD